MEIEQDYRVDFELHGFKCVPSDITKAMGIQPTFERHVGQELRRPKTGKVLRVAEESRWAITVDVPKGTLLEEQFSQLLDMIRPHKGYILELLKECECTWQVHGHSSDVSGQVGMYLPAAILNELHEYNSDIDIDVYYTDKSE